MSKFNIPEYIDISIASSVGVILRKLELNHENGWDHVFPYNNGSVTESPDPVWTDPGNNVRIRRSEIKRFGL